MRSHGGCCFFTKLMKDRNGRDSEALPGDLVGLDSIGRGRKIDRSTKSGATSSTTGTNGYRKAVILFQRSLSMPAPRPFGQSHLPRPGRRQQHQKWTYELDQILLLSSLSCHRSRTGTPTTRHTCHVHISQPFTRTAGQNSAPSP
jgi:hypothetical protein